MSRPGHHILGLDGFGKGGACCPRRGDLGLPQKAKPPGGKPDGFRPMYLASVREGACPFMPIFGPHLKPKSSVRHSEPVYRDRSVRLSGQSAGSRSLILRRSKPGLNPQGPVPQANQTLIGRGRNLPQPAKASPPWLATSATQKVRVQAGGLGATRPQRKQLPEKTNLHTRVPVNSIGEGKRKGRGPRDGKSRKWR